MTLRIGDHYSVIETIGEGTYGNVYRVKNRDGKEFAIKQIRNNEYGISCLLEAVIMSTFESSHINSAIDVFIAGDYMNIVQRLAKSDLTKYDQTVDFNTKKKWMWQIACALSALHKVGIIHADIKPGNILYFNEDDVRLADFTLSVKVWNEYSTFTHPIGTLAYCSPESLSGKEWSFPVDIWALGVSFYEIVHGKPLIKNQPKSSNRKEAKLRYTNAILDWKKKEITNQLEYNKIDMIMSDDRCFNDLLDKMLALDPENRLNINGIINHPFFSDFSPDRVMVNVIEYRPFSPVTTKKISNMISEIINPSRSKFNKDIIEQVIRSTLELYQRLSVEKNNLLLLTGCVWVASKLVIGKHINIRTSFSIDLILEKEIHICRTLSYCLIPITRNFYH